MEMQNEKQAVEALLAELAEALNAADTASIPLFYAEDGVFMPDGYKVLTRNELLKTGNSYLKRTGFKISFFITNVVINEPYAFVNAIAKTQTAEPLTNAASRDFFVLRKVSGEWKIYRYMFNHVKYNNVK
jgi:ketosteroid isomerase-like protein